MSFNPLNWFKNKTSQKESDEKWKKEMEEKERKFQETLRAERDELEQLERQHQEETRRRQREHHLSQEKQRLEMEQEMERERMVAAERAEKIQNDRLYFENQMQRLRAEKEKNDIGIEVRMDAQTKNYAIQKTRIVESERGQRALEEEKGLKNELDSEEKCRNLRKAADDHQKKLNDKRDDLAKNNEEFLNKLNFERSIAQQDWEQKKIDYQEKFERMKAYLLTEQWSLRVESFWIQRLEFIRSTKNRILGALTQLEEVKKFGLDQRDEFSNLCNIFQEVKSLLIQEANNLESLPFGAGCYIIKKVNESLMEIIKILDKPDLGNVRKLSKELEDAYDSIPTIQEIRESLFEQPQIRGEIAEEKNEDGINYYVEE